MTDSHVTLLRLLLHHVGESVQPSEGHWFIPHMYAEGIHLRYGPDIKHDRECPECGSTTFAWERCHVCGDRHWV